MTTINALPSFAAERVVRDASQRATTSSRHGSTVFASTVWVARARIVDCAKCGGKRYESKHPHAPMLRKEAGVSLLVDCVGDVLEVRDVE